MTPAPKRRWTFSLRTLFVVVTIVACWLGYELNWIRQRAQMRERINASRADTSHVEFISQAEFNERKLWGPGKVSQQLPLALWLLGAEPVALIVLPEDHFNSQEVERIERLFPEALVVPFELQAWNEANGK